MSEIVQLQEGITVLSPVIDRFTFTRPLRGEEARAVYGKVKRIVETDYKDIPIFDAYFRFNEETEEINGSNIPYAIIVNQVLEEEGLRLPTILEVIAMDAKGLLSNGVYRDYGLAVYSEGEPNEKVAERMIAEARKKWNLPILTSIKDLQMERGDKVMGVNITYKKDSEVLTDDKAEQYLKENFNFSGSSGACRVGRDWSGDWDAGWDWFDYSSSGGRVDWMCGEAATKNLEDSVLLDLQEMGMKEVERVNQRISNARKEVILAYNR